MKPDEASWDRVALVVLGVALILGGLLTVGGTGGYAMARIGLIPLMTGLMGWYPIYAIFRTGTKNNELPRPRPSLDLETPRTR